MTDAIVASARSVASPGTEIVGLTPSFGADSCEGNFDSYLAAVGVMDAVVRFQGSYDAVVQAGFGEHGREGLQELLDVPVIDITEAAGHLACLLGHRYSVVTTLDRTVPLIEDRLRLAGLDSRCASVRSSGLSVLELEEDPEAAVKAITAQAQQAVNEDRAEVIVLGCGGMAGLDEAVAARHRRPCRGRGHRRHQARRGPGRARPVDQQDPDVCHAASQAPQRLAGRCRGCGQLTARCSSATIAGTRSRVTRAVGTGHRER